MPKAGKDWHIAKYDGARLVWERQVPLYRFTTLQMGELLMRLASTNLTDEEVMNSADPALDTSLLGIHTEGNTLSSGDNPHYVARVIERE